MLIIQGGRGLPYLCRPFFDYILHGTYTRISDLVTPRDISDYELRCIVEKGCYMAFISYHRVCPGAGCARRIDVQEHIPTCRFEFVHGPFPPTHWLTQWSYILSKAPSRHLVNILETLLNPWLLNETWHLFGKASIRAYTYTVVV